MRAIHSIPLFMLGLFVIGVSAACVTGHYIESDFLCCWHGNIGMALNTAVCFMAIGAGFVILSRRTIE